MYAAPVIHSASTPTSIAITGMFGPEIKKNFYELLLKTFFSLLFGFCSFRFDLSYVIFDDFFSFFLTFVKSKMKLTKISFWCQTWGVISNSLRSDKLSFGSKYIM